VNKNLIERVQRLGIVEPEVVTGRHHPAPGRVRAAELVKREAVLAERRPSPVKR
jgi:hypothetical protein